MVLVRICFILSIPAGVSLLRAAGPAIPNALRWLRQPGPDAVRPAVIAVVVPTALALILQDRLLPALPRLADRGAGGAVRAVMFCALLCTMAMARIFPRRCRWPSFLRSRVSGGLADDG